jgi:hypothetical protein
MYVRDVEEPAKQASCAAAVQGFERAGERDVN